jgi:TolB protein
MKEMMQFMGIVLLTFAAGSGLVGCTSKPKATPNPHPTPISGARIAFVKTVHSDSFGADGDIYIISSDGTGLKPLVEGIGAMWSRLVWSPDGVRLAFDCCHNFDSEIYVVSADGSELKQLTNSRENYDPSWSPDGRQIAFSSQGKICIIDVDDGDLTCLEQNTGKPHGCERSFSPYWSPDGEHIAFISEDKFCYEELYIMDADGGERMRLTDAKRIPQDFSWSPDGSRIAFTKLDPPGEQSAPGESGWDIYVVDIKQRKETRLTNFYHNALHPTWSPDGKQIAFDSFRAIFIINADGTELRPLVNDEPFVRSPIWSPDGTQIVFSSLDSGPMSVINSDGTERKTIVPSVLDGTMAWQPYN